MRKLLFWAIVLLVALEIVVSNADWINYKLFFAQVIMGTLLFIWAIGLLLKPSLCAKSPLDIPLSFYIGWIFLSFLFSPFKSASSFALYSSLPLVIFYFLMVNSVTALKEIELSIDIWMFLAAWAVFYGIAKSSGLSIHFSRSTLAATFGNPNLFASFLVSILPFSIYKLVQAKNKQLKLLYVLFIAVLSVGLYLTGSRGGIWAGIITVFIFLLVLFYTDIKEKKAPIRALLCLSVAVIFAIALVFYKKLNPASILQGREYIWHGTWQMIKQKPLLGWGVGNFAIGFSQFMPAEILRLYPNEFVNSAHNEFLTITAELGIVGLGIFLWILAKIYTLVARSIKSHNQHARTLAIAAGSSVLGIILINLFDVSLHFVFSALFWWLAIGILVIVDKIEGKKLDIPKIKKSYLLPRFAAILVCLYISVNMIFYATHSLWTARIYNKSSNSFVLNLDQADDLIEEAQNNIKQNKTDARAYFRLGTIYAKKLDWQNAKIYLEKAVELDRSRIFFAYNNLGNVYFHLNDFDKAIDCYLKSLSISPNYLVARYNLGYAYFKKIKIKEAVKEFDFVLNKNRNDYEAWQMRQLIFE